MICQTCRMNMQPVTASRDFFNKGKRIEVIHIPAEQCPKCGKVEVSGSVMLNAQRFAESSVRSTVDYAEHESAENTVFIATQMLWRP